MAAGVALPLSVAAALMGSVPLVVVAAHCIRVIGQSACQQVGHRLVRRPRYAGIELDLRLGQGCSGPAADAAADQRLDAPLTQESSQRPVAAAGGVHHLAGSHRSVFHLIDLESLRVPKMLKDLSILICHCYFHVLSLLFHPVLFHSRPSRAAALLPAGQAAVFAPAPSPAPAAAAPAAAVLRLTAQVVSAPLDCQGPALRQHAGQLLPGRVVDGLHRGPGHIHLGSTLLLSQPQQVDEPHRLIFVHCHLDHWAAWPSFRPERPHRRQPAYPSPLYRPRHGTAPSLSPLV